jgi:tRNA-Thr(GGU) m(6)t(6)A37 methyltransferase TsaA
MIVCQPIGFVRASRMGTTDDAWGDVISTIELISDFGPESLAGLETFSHAEIVFHFHLASEANIEHGSRHPRDNTEWPKVGIFAQRGKDRPNRIGTTMVEIVGVADRVLTVRGLDAVDGTPVLDIKPVMAEFLPRTPVKQPDWARELMRQYW